MRKNSCRGSLSLLVAGVVSVGSSAGAQPRESRPGARLARAAELYQSGRYAEAIPELHAAYRANPLPRILCNLAQAYRKNDQPREAVEHYDLCLRTDPQLSAQERAEFTAHREQLRRSLAPEPSEPAQRPGSLGSAPLQTTPQPTPGEAQRPIYKRAWFWGVVGAAAAVIIATGVGVGVARSRSAALADPELPTGVPVLAW